MGKGYQKELLDADDARNTYIIHNFIRRHEKKGLAVAHKFLKSKTLARIKPCEDFFGSNVGFF
uniref:Uncharacterized protein n=1 Tax=Arundo donax TaxID=35708 RepID=A0A0A8XVF7_ARUDO